MALTATIHRFQLEISDVDRGVYDTVELTVAQHPSESAPYLVTRVLAMALEYRPGLTFGRGVSTPDEPAISAPNDMGGIALWIDIGVPSPDRLHKIAKQADEVRVYSHKSVEGLVAELAAGSIHRADEIGVVAFPLRLLEPLSERLTRNNRWNVLRTEGVVYVTIGDETFEARPEVYGPGGA